MAMADMRRDYSKGSLRRADLNPDPLAQFQRWFAQAAGDGSGLRLRRIGIALFKLWRALLGRSSVDATAMTLATADRAGRPAARAVLLKGADGRGFVFYTNYDSRKGRELSENPHAALTFYWPELGRQVCVEGVVAQLPRAESEAYFRSRPRGSRLAAWASNQSEVIPDRAALEKRWTEFAAKFSGADVPLPPNWGGYLLQPERIEFWQGRPDRLHDRFSYARQPDGSWKLERLAP